MALKLKKTPVTEQGLRERIHRMFVGDGCPTTRDHPHFWVEPTKEQRDSRFIEFHDGIQLADEIQTNEERVWLAAPHAGLGGKSPETLLTGNGSDRAALDKFITVFEEGPFT
ncbi:MAG: hypothetical protein OXE83_04035 [Gammaproteobacteria bacterium]|nr:hypothetical protein [Gammaproteobacteria bacterium]